MTDTATNVPSAQELRAKRSLLLAIRDDDTLPDERRGAARRAIRKLDMLEGELAEERMRARTEVFELTKKALGEAAAPMQESVADRVNEGVQQALDAANAALDEAFSEVLHHKDEPEVTDIRLGANDEVSGDATQEQREIIDGIIDAAAAEGLSDRFLGAVAFKESSLRNVKAAASSAFGPFQFLQTTWNGLVAQGGAKHGITEEDITDVGKQAKMAAIAFKNYQRTLERVDEEVTAASLYLCHLLGEGAAKACLAVNPTISIDQPLRELYSRTSLGAEFADKIIDANPFLKTGEGRPRSVGDVMAVIGEALERCEGKYLSLKGTAPSGETNAAPKWLQVALGEMDRGVHEVAGERHDDAIISYLASTTLPEEHHKDETAWCSAFVNWCIEQAGLKGTRSASARSWLEFGEEVDLPQLGEIVVFWRREREGRFGHVGFFIDEDDDNIILLGGNQTDPEKGVGAVCIKPYPRKRLLGFRRPAAP